MVAYYDGALHVVAGRADARESLVHEFTHHALQSAGFFAPTWAQEGMAMLVARECWWREPEWLERVVSRPLDLALMEQGGPYTLEAERAVLFYAQAAGMTACASREHATGLAGLLAALRAFAEPGAGPSCALPPAARRRASPQLAAPAAALQAWRLRRAAMYNGRQRRMSLAPGSRLGRHEVVAFIGAGGKSAGTRRARPFLRRTTHRSVRSCSHRGRGRCGRPS